MRASSAALLLLCACGSSAPAVIKTTSAPRPPSWTLKPPQGGGDLYFVGAIENAQTLDEGKESALARARAQAAQYLGVEITAAHESTMSSEVAENKAQDSVKTRATALIRNAVIADVYFEKISREAGATTIDRFDVWVLAKLPRAELEKEKDRQSSDAKAAMSTAVSRMGEARELERQGQMLQALLRYREVVAAAKGVPSTTETGDATHATARRLLHAAEDAAKEAQAKVRRALIVGSEAASGALTKAFSALGFTVKTRPGIDENSALAAARSDGTPWVIVSAEEHQPGGRVFNQVAARVALDVRALDARSGSVVASSQKQSKEVARTAAAAATAAAREAGLMAGKELAQKLVDKENESP